MQEANTVTTLTEVTRNGLTLPLQRREKEKGKAEGTPYFTLDIVKYKPGETEDELGDIDEEATRANLMDKIIPHLGWDFVAKKLQAQYNLMAQNAVSQAIEKDENGKPLPGNPINWDKLRKFHEELSARGESIPDMEARLKELGAELAGLFVKMSQGTPEEIAQHQSRGIKISTEMARLNNQIEARRRSSKEENAKEAEAVKA